MDSSLLSILGTIVQAYASLLGIIGMFLVFLRQRKDDRIRDLRTRFKIKADSLIDFINREIAPAYTNEPVIRVDSEDYDNVVEAIDQYQSEREKEIPRLDMKNVRRLLILWTIAKREKEELTQLRNALLAQSGKAAMPHRPYIFFVGYFAFELFFGFLGIFIVSIEHDFQYLITQLNIIFAIVGLLPLGSLIYSIR